MTRLRTAEAVAVLVTAGEEETVAVGAAAARVVAADQGAEAGREVGQQKDAEAEAEVQAKMKMKTPALWNGKKASLN